MNTNDKSYEFIEDGKRFAYDKNNKRIIQGCKVKRHDGVIISVLSSHMDVLEPFFPQSRFSIKHNDLEII